MLCRICLQNCKKENNEQIIDLFNEIAIRENIPDIISKYFWFKPNVNDVTKVICGECWRKILDFHHFYLYVQKNHDDYILQLSKNINIQDEKYSAKEAVQGEVGDKLAINIKEEEEMEKILEVDANVFLPSNCDNEVNPLDYGEFDNSAMLLHTLSENFNEFKKEFGKSITKKRRVTDMKIKSKINKRISDDSSKSSNKKIHKTSTKYHAQLIESLIKKHVRMVCDLCVYIGETFCDIVQHFTMDHPGERPYVMCCERKLSRRYLLNQHAFIYENPDFFRCYDCQKSFVDGSGLRAHMLLHHATEEEKTHGCELCPKKFARTLFLELHKRIHIPQGERTFFCIEYSPSKDFATEYLLQIHYNTKHKGDAHVCHVCAKTINDKHRFEKHIRFHSEDNRPRLKCTLPGCNSWLKDLDNLRQHLKDHNTEGKIYQCGQCAKTCKSSRSLSNHKRNSHSTETYKCEQCNKTFKRRITLKEHIAQHTSETSYSCPFCTRKFNCNANMHAHKKKMHPVEWNEWRQCKFNTPADCHIKHLYNDTRQLEERVKHLKH